jgi:hypothetical protein
VILRGAWKGIGVDVCFPGLTCGALDNAVRPILTQSRTADTLLSASEARPNVRGQSEHLG